MSDDLLVGKCPNCGPIGGETVEFNFAAPATCADCGAELDRAMTVGRTVTGP